MRERGKVGVVFGKVNCKYLIEMLTINTHKRKMYAFIPFRK